MAGRSHLLSMGKPSKVHVGNYSDRKRQMGPQFDKEGRWRIEDIRKKRVDAVRTIEREYCRGSERERQRECREKRNGVYVTRIQSLFLFTTKQSFGKAIMRFKCSVPQSPRKKRAAVLEMPSEFGLDVRQDSYSYQFSIRNQNSIYEDVKKNYSILF